MGSCHQCGTVLADKVGVRDTCPTCHAFLHCCRNCRLYNPGAHNHCLSSTTEYVRDVAAGNFCDEFEFTSNKKAAEETQQAKKKFDQLFGD